MTPLNNPRIFDWHLPRLELLDVLRRCLPDAISIDVDDDGRSRCIAFRLLPGIPSQSFFCPLPSEIDFSLTVTAIATAQGLEIRFTFPHEAGREL